MRFEVLHQGKVMKIINGKRTYYIAKTFIPFEEKLILDVGEGLFIVNTINDMFAYLILKDELKAMKFSQLPFSGSGIVISGRPMKSLCLFGEFLIPQIYPKTQDIDEFINFLNSFMSSVGNGLIIWLPEPDVVNNVRKRIEYDLKRIAKDYFKSYSQYGMSVRPIEAQAFYDSASRYLLSGYLVLVSLLSDVEIGRKKLFKKTMNIIDWLKGKGFVSCFSSIPAIERFLSRYGIHLLGEKL